jgi:hypothetical protein
MKQGDHHRREIIFLITILLLFGIVFLVNLINLRRHVPTLGLGLSYTVENWIIMILTFFAILKVFFMIMISDR